MVLFNDFEISPYKRAYLCDGFEGLKEFFKNQLITIYDICYQT